METLVRGRETGHLVAVSRAEERSRRERLSVGVRHDRASLLEAKGRGCEIVRRVVEHGSTADGLEALAQSGYLLDHPRTDVEVGIELPGDDSGQIVGGRAQVEHATPDRGSVDEPFEHTYQGQC